MTIHPIDRLVREANPVPHQTALEPADLSDLLVMEQWREDMDTQVLERTREPRQPRRVAMAIAAGVVVVALIGTLAAVLRSGGEEVAAGPVDIATGFLVARESGDIEAARSYLDESVVLDWGPGGDYDTLEQGLQWEDAVGIVNTVDNCVVLDDAATVDSSTVRCRLLIQTAVAAALGTEGIGCVDIVIIDGLIGQAVLIDPQPGCEFDFLSSTFAPFEVWMQENHPEASFSQLLDDRTSLEGIERWRQYTEEFVAEHGG